MLFHPSTIACACVGIATRRLKLLHDSFSCDSLLQHLAELLVIDLVSNFELPVGTFITNRTMPWPYLCDLVCVASLFGHILEYWQYQVDNQISSEG